MDHDSSLTLAQVPEGIGNHGYYSVDELLEASSLDEFLPNGYALVRLNTGGEERYEERIQRKRYTDESAHCAEDNLGACGT